QHVARDRGADAQAVIVGGGGGKHDRIFLEKIEIGGLNRGVAVVAKMVVAQQIDGEEPNRNLLRFDYSVDVAHRREMNAETPERLQFQQQRLVKGGVGGNLIIRTAGNG